MRIGRTVGLLMAMLICATVMPANAASVQPATRFQATGTGFDLISTLAGFAAPAQPLLHAVSGKAALTSGSDGRLTFLLIGSDARGGGVGLTDTIMVMSIKNKRITAASIPRDTARIPNPAGGMFSGRVNSVLKKLRKSSSSVAQALAKFEVVIENLLQIEIDYHAMIKFGGFDALVQEVEPIPVKNAIAIKDKSFWDDPNKPRGVYFPQWNVQTYNLYAWQPNSNPPLCNGLWKSVSGTIPSQYHCHRALPFVRSRKGAKNSDFVRAKRQQDFVVFAAKRVVALGANGRNRLLNRSGGLVSGGQLFTNIPRTAANALQLYNMLNGATVQAQVVFKPKVYSTKIKGTTAYQLKLDAVRNWCNTYLS